MRVASGEGGRNSRKASPSGPRIGTGGSRPAPPRPPQAQVPLGPLGSGNVAGRGLLNQLPYILSVLSTCVHDAEAVHPRSALEWGEWARSLQHARVPVIQAERVQFRARPSPMGSKPSREATRSQKLAKCRIRRSGIKLHHKVRPCHVSAGVIMFQPPVLAVDDPWHISHERGAELPHDAERFELAVVQQAPAQIRDLHENVIEGHGEHCLGGLASSLASVWLLDSAEVSTPGFCGD